MSNREQQSLGRWRAIKSLFRREKKVSILVDGPNLLRKHGNRQIKIEDIDQLAEKLGSVRDRYIFLNNHASKKLIEAMVNSGYNPVVVHSNIYVQLTMKALEIVSRGEVDILFVASRDARVVPLLTRIKEKGIDTAIAGFNPGFSVALSKTADYAFELK